MKNLFLLNFLFLLILQASAQGPLLTKNFKVDGGQVTDIGIVKTVNDEFVALLNCVDSVGANKKYVFLRLNKTGDIISQRAFNSTSSINKPCLDISADGSIIAVGLFTIQTTIVKLDSNFNVLWSRQLPTVVQTGSKVLVNQRGNYVVYGNENFFVTNHDGYELIEIDNNGNVLHEQLIEFLNGNYWNLMPYKDHDYLFTCRPGPYPGANFTPLDSALTPHASVKLFNESPVYTSASWYQGPSCLNPADSSLLQAGEAQNGGVNAMVLAKVDSGLNCTWIRKYCYPVNTNAKSTNMIHTTDNSYLLSLKSGINTNGGWHPGLMKTDTSGNILWCYLYGDTSIKQTNYIDFSFEVSDGYVHFGRSVYDTTANGHNLNLFWMMTTDFNGNTACNKIPFNFIDSVKTFNLSYSNFTLRNTSQISTVSVVPATQAFSENIPCIINNRLEMNSSENLFEIYPNPAQTSFELLISDNPGSANVTITDLAGREIYTKKIFGNQCKIDLTEMKAGTYLINVMNSKNSFTKKLIVN